MRSASTSSRGTAATTKSSTASRPIFRSGSSPEARRASSRAPSVFRATRSPRPVRSRPRHAERRISLGRVNGRRFTFSAGFGIDAELVRRVDALGRASGKRANDLAFARDARGDLRRESCALRAGHGGGGARPRRLRARRQRPPVQLRRPDPAAHRTEGEVRARARPRRSAGAQGAAIAPGRRLGPRREGAAAFPHVLYVHDADELVVRADRPMPLQVDGEDLGDVEEAHFEAERSALRVLVPE